MNTLLFILLFMSLVPSLACSSSTFSGSTAGAKGKEPKKNVVEENGYEENETEEVPSASDLKPKKKKTNESKNSGLEEPETDEVVCTKVKRGKIRIALLVDASNTVHKHLGDVSSSAQALLQDIKTKAAQKDSPQFFFTGIQLSSHEGDGPVYQSPEGWVEVTESDSKAAEDALAWVTQKAYDGAYDNSFALAYEQFKGNGASVSNRNERNYIVAIGDEEYENHKTFPNITNQLSSELGVAILHYQVADKPNGAYRAEVAMPTSGIVTPEHLGKSFAKANGEDSSLIFQHIGGQFKDLTFCD